MKGDIGFAFPPLPVGGRSLRDIDLRRQFHALALAAQSPRSIRSVGEVVVGTSVGLARSDNQDVALHLRVKRPRAPESDFQVSVVCDGMGGLKAGREAAALAASRFLFALLRDSFRERRFSRDSCLRAARTADAAVYQRMNGGGGTTLSAVITNAEGISIGVHVGDSRIYAVDDEGALHQISKDDNLRSALNQDQEIDAALGSRLIQFIGMGDEIEPHVFRIPDDAGRLLITSDGAHSGAMSTLASIVRFAPSSPELVRRILNVAEYTGGLDNASVIVVPMHPANSDHWLASDDAQVITVVTPFDSVEFYLPDYFDESDRPPYRYYGGSAGSPVPKSAPPPPPPSPPPPTSSSAPITSPAPAAAPPVTAKDQQGRVAAAPEPPQAPKSAKPPRKRKARSAPRKKAESGGELPLEAAPSILVEFPNDEGEPE